MPVIIGKQYGRLTVLYKCDYFYENEYTDKKTGKTRLMRASMYHVKCSCEAGTEFDVLGQSLTSGNTKSCGCLFKEFVHGDFLKRGEKTRFKRNFLDENEPYVIYDLSGEYGIGYTYDTREKFIFDLEDYDKIKRYFWRFRDSGYVIAVENGETIYLHRLVMNCEDKTKDVDHIHHNLYDCRKNELRICEHYQNITSQKLRKDNKSGHKGVYYRKDREKWVAQITYNKIVYHLGNFDTFEEAVQAREKAEREIHGEFNYIESSKEN